MELPLCGVDVVELSPPFDHAEVTAFLSNRIVLEALSGIAWRRARLAGRPVRHPATPSWSARPADPAPTGPPAGPLTRRGRARRPANGRADGPDVDRRGSARGDRLSSCRRPRHADGSRPSYDRRSTIIAIPWPPPTHIDSRPKVVPASSRPLSRVVMMRAPVWPKGWPRAMAPPFTFSLS